MSPGDELYSCAGHSVIRLECPRFNLDYCFSYESEGVKDKIFAFLAGRLKMGMFAIPTADYLKLGRESGRGVMQYTLNLPPDAKQRLWKLLDGKVAEGAYLPYDYLERGCAQSALRVLREALAPCTMDVEPWPEKYAALKRNELLERSITDYPWQTFLLYTICGSTTDEGVSRFGKVVVPKDLLEILSIAKVGGRHVVRDEGVELLPVLNGSGKKRPLVTPFALAWLVVAISLVNYFVKRTWMDWCFFAAQTALGLFLTYMVFFSGLKAIEWNWLVVPFNLLPPVLWKWRREWAMWYVAVLAMWELGMLASRHRLTDPAWLVFAVAYMVFYLKFTRFDGGWWRALVADDAAPHKFRDSSANPRKEEAPA